MAILFGTLSAHAAELRFVPESKGSASLEDRKTRNSVFALPR
jgi:hypothetical protein